MVEILGMVSAVLLILCLLLISAVLRYQSMLKEAGEEIDKWLKLAKRIEKQTEENAATIDRNGKQIVEAIEENTRLTCELAIANLSLKNCQNQHGELVELFGQVKEERDEYKGLLEGVVHIFVCERDLIEGVLRKHRDFEAQDG